MSNHGDKEKEVRYLSKDFDSLKDNLEEFLRVYYPDTYNDFSDSSIGSVFVDLSAYVGDVLSYYTDTQFKENLLQYAKERENVFDLANTLGYRPTNSSPSVVELDVFVRIPAKELGPNDNKEVYNETFEVGDVVPDLSYAPIIKEGMVVSADSNNTQFRTLREIDFGEDRFDSPVETQIFEENDEGMPEEFLLMKKVKAVSGTITTETFSFNEPVRFNQITLSRDDVLEILDVTDSDGNEWTQVPYLAQETVFKEFRNTERVDSERPQDSETRFVLDTIKTPRRFTRRTQSDGSTILQFGSGVSDDPNERIVPNAKNIGDPTARPIDKLEFPLDPSNFLSVDTYGQVPYDTELEVTYTYGGGVSSNVPNNDIINIENVEFDLDVTSGLDSTVVNRVRNSVAVINKEPATGGDSGESTEEIRQNAMAFFSAQDRVITREDYRVRALSMPPRYGSVSKVYVTRDGRQENESDEDFNPMGVDLYVLGFNNQKDLVPVSDTVKENLRKYLSQYKPLTDGVNIKDGFVINIQVEYSIVVFNSFNRREVLAKTVDKVKEFFDIDNITFNEPIIIGEIINEINEINGVQNVSNIQFRNVYDENEGYSGNIYDIESATKDDIIYPSLDPSIFEVRYPNRDIMARSV